MLISRDSVSRSVASSGNLESVWQFPVAETVETVVIKNQSKIARNLQKNLLIHIMKVRHLVLKMMNEQKKLTKFQVESLRF